MSQLDTALYRYVLYSLEAFKPYESETAEFRLCKKGAL